VARLLGAEHHEIPLGDIDADTAQRVIAALDEPMADAACLPTFVLAREASRTARVALTGDGADALLAGDHWFRRLKRLDALARMPSVVRALIPGLAFFAEVKNRGRWGEMARLAARPPAQRYLGIRQKWTPEDRRSIYDAAFAKSVDQSLTAATYLNAPVGWGERGSVEAAIRLDASHGLPEDLLMKADKMCGAHGVDSRSPFMDQQWVEWAARLDVNLHLRGESSKDLLKRAAESLLPRDLVWRRKHGFQTPVGVWMKGPLRELTQAAFDASLLRRQAIFDAAVMARLKARFEAAQPGPGSQALNGRVWQIVAFQTWWRQVFERS
jgi:asparagine synthase (glutamine-hydrolysing)